LIWYFVVVVIVVVEVSGVGGPPNNRRNTKTTEEPALRRKVESGLSVAIHDKKHEIYLKNRLCNNNDIAKTVC
jgi:hypothetical protein